MSASKRELGLQLLASLRQDRQPVGLRPAPRLIQRVSHRDAAQTAQIAEMRRFAKTFEDGETAAQIKEKRGNKRFSSPTLRVMVRHQIYSSLNWSIGGIHIVEWDDTIKTHERIRVAMSDGGACSAFHGAEARVVRVDRKAKTLSLQFVQLSRGAFDWLSRLQLQQRKKMVSGETALAGVG